MYLFKVTFVLIDSFSFSKLFIRLFCTVDVMYECEECCQLEAYSIVFQSVTIFLSFGKAKEYQGGQITFIYHILTASKYNTIFYSQMARLDDAWRFLMLPSYSPDFWRVLYNIVPHKCPWLHFVLTRPDIVSVEFCKLQ